MNLLPQLAEILAQEGAESGEIVTVELDEQISLRLQSDASRSSWWLEVVHTPFKRTPQQQNEQREALLLNVTMQRYTTGWTATLDVQGAEGLACRIYPSTSATEIEETITQMQTYLLQRGEGVGAVLRQQGAKNAHSDQPTHLQSLQAQFNDMAFIMNRA